LLADDDMGRLLDFERGRFYALNATCTRLLNLTLEHGAVQAVHRVAREHGVEEGRVRADWARLLSALRRKGLVRGGRRERRRVPPGRPGLWLLFALIWISLRLLGLERTVRLCRGEIRPMPEPWNPDLTPLVRQIDQVVRTTAATHPLNPQCKERALV